MRGAHLVVSDLTEVDVTAERLDDGGTSPVSVRVCGLLAYVVLKILAFQDRHDNKDAYDLVFSLLNFGGGPEDAGRTAAGSDIATHPDVEAALRLLGERFTTVDHDGAAAYAAFLGADVDDEARARLRQEAVAVVRTFVAAFTAEGEESDLR